VTFIKYILSDSLDSVEDRIDRWIVVTIGTSHSSTITTTEYKTRTIRNRLVHHSIFQVFIMVYDSTFDSSFSQ